MAQELSNSPLVGAAVAGEGVVAGAARVADVAASSAAAGAAAAKPRSKAAATADRMGALVMAFLLIRLLISAQNGMSQIAICWSNISIPYVTGVTLCPIASL